MEAFNKTIIQKLEYIYLQNPKNFDVNIALSKAIKIYNTTIHSIIKVEPEKAFKFKKKKQINKIIENVLKSQISENLKLKKIEHGTKGLLFNKFSLNNNILKEIKNKNKGKYCILIL